MNHTCTNPVEKDITMSVVDKEKSEVAGEMLDSTAETYLSLRYIADRKYFQHLKKQNPPTIIPEASLSKVFFSFMASLQYGSLASYQSSFPLSAPRKEPRYEAFYLSLPFVSSCCTMKDRSAIVATI